LRQPSLLVVGARLAQGVVDWQQGSPVWYGDTENRQAFCKQCGLGVGRKAEKGTFLLYYGVREMALK
jgi:hypothetical protein